MRDWIKRKLTEIATSREVRRYLVDWLNMASAAHIVGATLEGTVIGYVYSVAFWAAGAWLLTTLREAR